MHIDQVHSIIYRYNMKFYAGPLWDVNLGFGNIDYADGGMVEK
jgi:hypothetical protein